MKRKVKTVFNGSKILVFFQSTGVLIIIFFRPYTCKCLPGTNTQEFTVKIADLKKKISKLNDYEHELDLHRLWIEQSIRNTTEDLETRKYLYVTDEDFSQRFDSNDRVVIVNTPINNSTVKFEVS